MRARTFTLSVGTRCQRCIMPARLTIDLMRWAADSGGDVAEAIMQHIERRCGACLDSCWAEETAGHVQIDVAAID